MRSDFPPASTRPGRLQLLELRDSFLDLHMAVAARRYDGWIEHANGALALLILTDQFPRNTFRGTGHMYAADPLARHYARLALDAG